jgi:hypothetical protein
VSRSAIFAESLVPRGGEIEEILGFFVESGTPGFQAIQIQRKFSY